MIQLKARCDVKCDDIQNWLSLIMVEIGVGTCKAIASVAGEDTRKDLQRSFRKCLKTLCMYFANKSCTEQSSATRFELLESSKSKK